MGVGVIGGPWLDLNWYKQNLPPLKPYPQDVTSELPEQVTGSSGDSDPQPSTINQEPE